MFFETSWAARASSNSSTAAYDSKVAKQLPPLPNDGIVRIFRGRGGRGGGTISVVRGLPRRELQTIARDLKKHCGSGGTVKDGAVEIQGDHREKIAARLAAEGYTVKLAGG